MATFGHKPVEPLPWLACEPALRPRMKTSFCPGPLLAEVTFGRYFRKSSKVLMLSCCSACPVSACMEIGTSCILSVRRCAVTITSVMPSLAVVSVLVACSCAETATVVPPKMAATAYEIFDFIGLPPQIRHRGCAALPAPERLDMTPRRCD